LTANLLFSTFLLFASSATAQNAIATENALPGNSPAQWDITGSGDLSIQGFATDISVNKGETVHFKIKTDANAYTIKIYRLGYYQGKGLASKEREKSRQHCRKYNRKLYMMLLPA
jgi:hypothetical protein